MFCQTTRLFVPSAHTHTKFHQARCGLTHTGWRGHRLSGAGCLSYSSCNYWRIGNDSCRITGKLFNKYLFFWVIFMNAPAQVNAVADVPSRQCKCISTAHTKHSGMPPMCVDSTVDKPIRSMTHDAVFAPVLSIVNLAVARCQFV